jgi:DNA-binding response OmpR family regulator
MSKLLIIEDDSKLRHVLAAALGESGHDVSAYAGGSILFEVLLQSRFDLAIIAWKARRMSGLELVRRLRRQFVGIPVLVVTTRQPLADRVVALDAGADDCLVKPFQMRELEARVRALLRRCLNYLPRQAEES